MGIKIQKIAFSELNEAWKTADKDEAKSVADQWVHGAKRVVDVPRETLDTSAAMYLAQKALLKRHGASGITINCLGGFYGGHIHAYPCLGFHQLCSEGLVGGCGATFAPRSHVGNVLAGPSGYISDPVIDTQNGSSMRIVASNKRSDLGAPTPSGTDPLGGSGGRLGKIIPSCRL
jgi:hypothetical protein